MTPHAGVVAAGTWMRAHWGGLVVAYAFVTSRVVLAQVAGLSFDNRPLNDALQLLDRGALRDRLVESVLHLHSQPPLFNLFIGLGLQAPPAWQTTIFHGAYLAAGLALALCVYAILCRCGASRPVAVVLALLFTLSPSVFLYESWLHYDYPLTLGLCLATWALQRYESERRPSQAAAFSALLAAVVLTRSLFHIAWFVLCGAAVVVAARQLDRRKLVAAIALPAVAVFGLHLHRLVVFGQFSTSSSLGISLAKITIWQLDDSVRVPLVYSGELGRISLAEPLSPAGSYAGSVAAPAPTGVPALDRAKKARHQNPTTANGFFRTNANHAVFLSVSDAYLKDSLYVIRHHPDAYLRGVATATETYFRPSSDFFTLAENRQRVSTYNRWYNRAVLGVVAGGQGQRHLPEASNHYRLGRPRTAWVVVAGYAVAFVAGGVVLARHALRRARDDEPVLVVAFLWFTMVYVFVVSNALEVGENNRFRLYSDPLVLALLTLLAARRRRLRSASGTAGTPPPSAPA